MLINCYNRNSAIDSIIRVYNLSWIALCFKIRKVSASFDPDLDPIGIYDPDHLRIKAKRFDICWYHATRTWDPNSYTKGIRPLSDVVDEIKCRIENLMRRNGIKSSVNEAISQSNSPFAQLYLMKINDHNHGGPYGFLIRSAIFEPSRLGYHDYLKIPEIVEDVLMCVKSLSGIDLTDQYNFETKKVIIKFKSEYKNDYALRNVIGFAYTGNVGMNTFCDNKGIVPESHILEIDVI